MTYTVKLTDFEIRIIRSALILEGVRHPPGSAERADMERLYKMLLDVTTASDNIARRMQEEGDKYGHD
jgi:hypothetical protein